MRTIVDEIELALKVADDEGPRSVEGLDDATWVLMDYGDVIVHVFLGRDPRVLRPRPALGRRRRVVDWEPLAALAERA